MTVLTPVFAVFELTRARASELVILVHAAGDRRHRGDEAGCLFFAE